MEPKSDIEQGLRTVLEQHPRVTLAILFGSVANGTARFESDLDLAVHAESPLTTDEKMRLIGDLAVLSGRPIDLIDMRTAGLPILRQIFTKGRRILGSDTLYATLLTRFQIDYADFMPLRERMLRERRMRWLGK